MQGKSKSNSAKNTGDGIVIPPGCDNPVFHDCGETVSTYTPQSYTPFRASQFSSSLSPHAMHGKAGALSIPKNSNSLSCQSMTEYLRHFQGANLCLDLWMDDHVKLKTCGILMEIGSHFLVIQETNNRKITLIDLKPVRYINIYCK